MKNNVYIGCSGFSGRDWKGFFYPEDLPSKEQLTYYSSKFSSVEINSTFYRKPRRQTLQNWYNLTSSDFRFFIKIPKSITHIQKLEEVKTTVSEFCRYIETDLKEKLAGFLFQLPPSFHFSEENLKKVLETVDPAFLNVVEFRHASWWRDDVFETLKNHDIIFSGVSYPKNISGEFITNHPNAAYYRLHGVPVMFKSEYSEEEMDELATEISNTDREVYVFFNNTWGTSALKNALYLKKILKV